jgi:protease-4
MASLASDYVVAHNGTITGSIGVLMESPDVSVLANKVGVKFNSYKSSPLKCSPSMFEKSTPMVDRVINESIKDSYQFFVELVKERRGEKLNPKFYDIIFDGRVFTGRQALKLGLIDKVGGIEDVERFLFLNKIDVNKFTS